MAAVPANHVKVYWADGIGKVVSVWPLPPAADASIRSAKYSIAGLGHEYNPSKIAPDEMALFPLNRAGTEDPELSDDTMFMQFQAVGLLIKARHQIIATDSVLSIDKLAQRLLCIRGPALAALCAELKEHQRDTFLSVDSIHEEKDEEVQEAAADLADQLRVMNLTDDSEIVELEGMEMLPFKILPDDAGVEFRSLFACHFRVATNEYAERTKLAIAEHDSKVIHTRKLLRDLPMALEHSKEALQKYGADNKDLDIQELGVMTYEQIRIAKEIEVQKSVLAEHEALPAPRWDASQMTAYKRHAKMVIPFGVVQKVGAKKILLVKIPQAEDAPTVEISTTREDPSSSSSVPTMPE